MNIRSKFVFEKWFGRPYRWANENIRTTEVGIATEINAAQQAEVIGESHPIHI